MSAKRRWSESSNNNKVYQRKNESAQDCQQILSHHHNESEAAAAASLVRSSWFSTRVEWISSAEENDAVLSGHNNTHILHERQDLSLLKDEIKSCSRQLLQAKRRLWPAAKRCAEACNNHASSLVDNSGNCDGCYRYASEFSATTEAAEFWEARRACNPYEVLGEGRSNGLNDMFMNRAAIKLANIDAILNFDLSNMKNQQLPFHQTTSLATISSSSSEPFQFVDLCGAPGGFSEYLLKKQQCDGTSRRSFNIRGYGMSLIGSNEHGRGANWRLKDGTALFSEDGSLCSKFTVCEGTDGTGDIYDWDNVEALRSCIQIGQQNDINRSSNYSHSDVGDVESQTCRTSNGKAHLVLADGGFDAQRNAENQEELSQKIIVCQVAAALYLLRKEGTMIIKMFGFQTATTRAVLWELFSLFDKIAALKPISSRPASAERYVVATQFKGVPASWDGREWRDRMFLGGSWMATTRTTDVMTTTSGGDGNQKEQELQQRRNQQRLEHYLECFDRDMLQLNLKTCFSILSFLESKCMTFTTNGNGTQIKLPLHEPVNVEAYKDAWKL